MRNVHIYGADKAARVIPAAEGETVLDSLDRAGIPVHASCAGRGACGLCLVRLERGRAEPPDPAETARLSEAQRAAGVRLACRLRPLADVAVTLLTPPPERLWRRLADLPPPQAVAASGLTVAVDLGTTHLRLSLCDGSRRLAAVCGPNPQARLGADIITRLAAAAESPERAGLLARLAWEGIADGMRQLCGLRHGQVRRLAIVGNTAMLVLLGAGRAVELLQPENWSRRLPCQTAPGWAAACGVGEVLLVEGLGGFVGSDCLAAVLAARLTEAGPAMLIDFGTNTEIALWDGASLWVTSAAGGPAFEGGGMLCGMPAEPGAINRVDVASGEIEVIGGGLPFGLCGSGLVDLIAGLRDARRLTAAGRFSPPVSPEGLAISSRAPGLFLHPHDLDAFQRAKAAVGVGVVVLLEQAGLAASQLERLCVTGAFGRRLGIAHAQSIGLLPAVPASRVELCCETALLGCESLMTSEAMRGRADALRSVSRLISLASKPEFDDIFIHQLRLDPMG